MTPVFTGRRRGPWTRPMDTGSVSVLNGETRISFQAE